MASRVATVELVSACRGLEQKLFRTLFDRDLMEDCKGILALDNHADNEGGET